MTMTQQQQQAVLEVLEEKIMTSLLKLKAREEEELRAKFTGVPKAIMTQALKNLNEAGQIKRARSQSGLILIALDSANKADLRAAADRYYAAIAQARKNLKRRELINDLDPKLCRDVEHYSQKPTFGLSYEQALVADYDEAVLADPITTEFGGVTRRTGNHATDNMSADKVKLLMRQELSGQGFRNTKRAFKRFKEREQAIFNRINVHNWVEAESTY